MVIRLNIDRVANGGEGIGRVDGKTVFVPGAVPGDVVDIEIVESKARYDRGRISDLVEASPDRTIPLCRHTDVCGGCTWQFVEYPAQLGWKREVVESQLRHIGGIEIEIPATMAVSSPFHYRNRMDMAVREGRLALHARASHELVALEECRLVVEPLAQVVSASRALGDLAGERRRVTLRAGVETGELVAVVDEPIDGLPIHQAHPSEATIHEIVEGVRFRVSGRAFFQANTAGAGRLVQLVMLALQGTAGSLIDLYAGVGLFGATVGRSYDRVIALEIDRRAVDDLAVNLPDADIRSGKVEELLPRLDGPVGAVVVDPSREGMPVAVIDAIGRLRPEVVASVSCDPATFARDAKRLVERGYELVWVQPVDLFPHTPHVEIVGRFERV